MRPDDFDQWRERYDQLTYVDQQAFAADIFREHPVQEGWRLDLGMWASFFDVVTTDMAGINPTVCELGGWDGSMASWALELYSIRIWLNIDLCAPAVMSSPMIDRYTTWVPNVFLWELGQLPHYHVYLASHFIEHIRERELLLLLKAIPQHGRFLAFSAPLPEEGPTDWAGYHGSHILEVGWDEVGRIVERHEWAPILELWTPGFRAWRREV